MSAGTAAAYIEGEWTGMPFRPLVLGILILVGQPLFFFSLILLSLRVENDGLPSILLVLGLGLVFTALLLVGVRDSTTLTLSICLFHVRLHPSFLFPLSFLWLS